MARPAAQFVSRALAGVPHVFLGRDERGTPPDPGLIVPGARLVQLRQTHSALALAVHTSFPAAALPEGDALATATPGLVLAIRTADCAPVLLADQAAGVVGAAHAGWRGALGGVLEACIATMEALGAQRRRIVAAIGPTIAQPSYEVDEAFRARFLAADAANAAFFAPGRAGHWQFDLPAHVAARLAAAGIAGVDDLGLDTYAGAAQFHSHRRATHLGQADQGRQFALIACG